MAVIFADRDADIPWHDVPFHSDAGHYDGCCSRSSRRRRYGGTRLVESMLGFDTTLTSLMIALYIAQDSFGTACNVTGDGAIAVITDRVSKSEPA